MDRPDELVLERGRPLRRDDRRIHWAQWSWRTRRRGRGRLFNLRSDRRRRLGFLSATRQRHQENTCKTFHHALGSLYSGLSATCGRTVSAWPSAKTTSPRPWWRMVILSPPGTHLPSLRMEDVPPTSGLSPRL